MRRRPCRGQGKCPISVGERNTLLPRVTCARRENPKDRARYASGPAVSEYPLRAGVRASKNDTGGWAKYETYCSILLWAMQTQGQCPGPNNKRYHKEGKRLRKEGNQTVNTALMYNDTKSGEYRLCYWTTVFILVQKVHRPTNKRG
jgi:hypothetical protein